MSGEASKFVSTEPYEEDFRYGGEELTVFPNPASNRIFIKNHSQEPDRVIVKTETGKVVQTAFYQKNSGIDIESIKEGRYFVEIISGKKSTVRRLLVNRNWKSFNVRQIPC